jgi:hypothetical protein
VEGHRRGRFGRFRGHHPLPGDAHLRAQGGRKLRALHPNLQQTLEPSLNLTP